MKFNNKYIFPGDSKNEIIDKVNFNFDQILSSGFGATGFNGGRGATGVIGRIGPDGSQGPTGTRSTNWFQQSTAPSTAGAQTYDYWINTSPTNQDEIYIYSGPTAGWQDTGSSLRTSGFFTGVQGINGPEGATGYNAIVINATGPNTAKTTFVFADTVLTASNVNPLQAKVLIATNSSTNSGSILGFSKTTTNSPGYPRFSWGSTGTDYSLDLSTISDLKISAGTDLNVSSSNGTIDLSGNVLNYISGTSTEFTSATGGISISSNSTIQVNSKYATFKGSDNSIDLPVTLGASGATGQSRVTVRGSLFDVALLGVSSGPTGSLPLMSINDVNGRNLLKAKQDSQVVIGVTGSTGSHLIKSFVTIQCKMIPVEGNTTGNINQVNLTSPDIYGANDILLEFPSSLNQNPYTTDGSYSNPVFYASIPSPYFSEVIAKPNEITSYRIYNGATGFTFSGLLYDYQRLAYSISGGSIATILQKRIEFGTSNPVSSVSITYTPDYKGFYFNAGVTGGFVNLTDQ